MTSGVAVSPPEDLTTAEVARTLGISHGAVRKRVARGVLASRLEETRRGPVRMVTAAEVERYRREHLGRQGRPAKIAPP